MSQTRGAATDFFTSDLHFGQIGTLGFDQRPFASVEEMNAELIRRWNARVTDRDTVYVLGDLMWNNGPDQVLAILNALKGHMVLIRGNHDKRWLRGDAVRGRFLNIVDYMDMRVKLPDGTRKCIAMSHYPIHFYNHAHHNGCMFYGHVHASREYLETELYRQALVKKGIPCEMHNVFCGLFDWAPATLDEVLARPFSRADIAWPAVPIKKPCRPGAPEDESDDGDADADDACEDAACEEYEAGAARETSGCASAKGNAGADDAATAAAAR